jgi:hypothetical protein
MMRKVPSTQSSTNMKLRVCSPSPHISNCSVEQMALRQNAAGAFSRPPVKDERRDEKGEKVEENSK